MCLLLGVIQLFYFFRFENYFRLNKAALNYVLEEIVPIMKSDLRSTSVSVKIKLAATLRFLGQGSYQLSVGNDFQIGLSQPSVCKILAETLNALERVICPQWIKLEMTEDEKSEAKIDFFNKTGFPSVIGCVDGTHIKILAPNKEDQNLYYNRKKIHFINSNNNHFSRFSSSFSFISSFKLLICISF